MAIGSAVLSAGDVNPEVLAIGGLEDELVEVSVMFDPVKPLAGGFKVGMTFVVVPGSIAGERQADVSSFAQGVLGGIGATNLDVELVATVAGADDDGAANEPTEGFEDFLAELLQSGDVLGGDTVVNTTGGSGGRLFKLGEHKVLGKT